MRFVIKIAHFSHRQLLLLVLMKYFVSFLKQEKAVKRFQGIPGDLTRWEELPLQQRINIFKHLKDQGPSILKAHNTVLVMCARLIMAVLSRMMTPPSRSQLASPFYAPLGVCLELECQGRADGNFQELEGLQERFLDSYCRRECISKAIMILFQQPPISQIYVNDVGLSRVSTVLFDPFCKYFHMTKILKLFVVRWI
jgi:hypothetical protein